MLRTLKAGPKPALRIFGKVSKDFEAKMTKIKDLFGGFFRALYTYLFIKYYL